MVYFAKFPCGPIKIGQSGNVAKRIQYLRREFGRPGLFVLRVEPGFEKEEAEMHARFAHLRIGVTEQFRPGLDLTDYLGIPAHPDPDSVEEVPSAFPRRENHEFRSIAKSPIPGQAPSEIVEAIRIRAATQRRSHSEVVSELLSLGLGLDPLRFGIRPDARRTRHRDVIRSN